MARGSLVLLLRVISAVRVGGAVTYVFRGSDPHPNPAPAASLGLGDDDANMMRVLQHQKLARAGK